MKWFRKCLLGSAGIVGGVYAFIEALTIFPTPTNFLTFIPHVMPAFIMGGIIGAVPVILCYPFFRRLKEEPEEEQAAA